MRIVLLIVAASAAFTVALVVAITLALRSSAAYRAGVERASRSRAVIELIGEPVRAGFFVRGGLRGGGRLASLRVPLVGSRAAGTLKIRAVREGEELRFEVLTFQSKGKVIDLLNTNAA